MTNPNTALAHDQQRSILIDIDLPTGKQYRFQNFQSQSAYFYNGQPYQFVNFDGRLLATNGIGVSGGGNSVEIVNTDARTDSLRPVRDWLMVDDGWRQGIVIIRQIWPEDISIPPIEEKHRILRSSIKKRSSATITLEDPMSAVNATVPSFYLTPTVAPELPSSSVR